MRLEPLMKSAIASREIFRACDRLEVRRIYAASDTA